MGTFCFILGALGKCNSCSTIQSVLFGAWTVGALTTGAGDVEQVCRLGTMAMSKVLVEEEGPLSGYMSIIPYNKCSGCEIMSPIYKKLKTNSYMSIVSENEKWFSLKTTCLWFYFIFLLKTLESSFSFWFKKKSFRCTCLQLCINTTDIG